MSEELNKELEGLLDAELTGEEQAAVEQELTEVEEVGGVVKFKTPSGKAKPLKAGGGEKSELKDESEDLGDEPESAADKAKKAKPTNSAGGEGKVSQGSSGETAPGEKMKLAAGD